MPSSEFEPADSLTRKQQWLLLCSVVAVYVLFAEIGHALSFPGHFATFWLPAGLSLAAYLSIATAHWPVVLLATLTANLVSDVLLHDKSITVGFGFWIANTTEALSAVWLIRRSDSVAHVLRTVRSTLTFVLLTCVVSTALGATLGATVVWLAFRESYSSTWQIWWSGDFIGMLVTFPFVWILLNGGRRWKTHRDVMAGALRPISAGVYVGLLLMLCFMTHYVFGTQTQRLAYVVFPVLLWLVMRFDVLGASTGLFAMALIAVADTAAGYGIFGNISELTSRAIVLQIFLFVSATTFLTLAAIVCERKDAERQLQKSQFTIDRASDAVFWIREDGSFSYANEMASQYLGYSNAELLRMGIADITSSYPVESWRRHWNETKQQGGVHFESVHQRKGGTTYDCELKQTLVEFENEELIVASVRDISDRKANQRDLYRSHTALDTAADAVLWVSEDGGFLYVNDEACRRLMYSRAQLLQMTVADINPELESVEQFREQFWPRIQKEKQLVLQMRHQRSDGSTFPTEIVTHLIRFEGEEFACSFVRDITERVAAEAELKEARSKLELAISGGNVGLWDWSVKTGDVNFSDQWHRQLGESPGTLTKLDDWNSRLHPDDIEQARGVVARVLANRTPHYQSTFRLMHRDGGYRWILARGKLFCDDDDNPDRMIGTHVDVTELQQTQDKLKSLIGLLGSTDGAWNWDLQTDVVDFSARFRELLGFAADDTVGFPNELASLKEHVHVKDRADFWENIDRHLTQNAPFDHEFRLQRSDGSFRWFRARGMALRDENGKAQRMAGSIYDVTDRKAVELQLMESNSDLEQFAYVASHDLQEPLRAVGGFCQLLQRRYNESLDEKGRGYIDNAVDGVNRMTVLINDLLEFSRVGRETRRMQRVSLQEVVESALKQLTVAVKETDARVTLEELPTVTGDTPLLRQLFQNLISNAIKFRRPEIPPTIRVFAVQSESFWDVSVEDNGIGMEAEHTDRIFTIFKRLHRREEIPGTGIGLAICKRIADRHHGLISVDSSPGNGTTFTLRLPVEEKPNV